MPLPRSLFPFAVASQIARILSKQRLEKFGATTSAKAFSSSAKSTAPRVSFAKIPTEILSDKLTASAKTEKSLIINALQIQKHSSDLWKFLKKEESANADIASIVKAIEEFRTGKTRYMIFEGGFQKVDFADSGIGTQNLSTDYSNSDDALKAALQELGKQKINLYFIQTIFALCGLRAYDARTAGERTFAHVLRGRGTQPHHHDGFVVADEKSIAKPSVDANALFATRREKSSKQIFTSLIDINDIVAMLDEKTKKILRQPFFYNPLSAENNMFAGAHPILYLDENNQLDALYPKGLVSVYPGLPPKNGFDAHWALNEFRAAIVEAEKSQGLKIELGIDKNGTPKEIVVITGMHRRIGYEQQHDLDQAEEIREIVAVTAKKTPDNKDEGSPSKTLPAINPTLPDEASPAAPLDKSAATGEQREK